MKKYLKSLVGFPIGNLMLALSYIIIYLVDGEETYVAEISKLAEFKYLLGQVVFSGITFLIVVHTIVSIFDLFEDNGKNVSAKKVVMYAISLAAIFAVAELISLAINRKGSLKGYSGSVFTEISCIMMMGISIVYVLYQEVQNVKINRALRKKQNNN